MASPIKIELDGFDGDNVVMTISGSKYNGRSFYFTPKLFVQFLKTIHKTSSIASMKTNVNLVIELPNEAPIEVFIKYLKG